MTVAQQGGFRRELADDLAARLVADEPRSCVLRGPAGIGKSHMSRAVAELVQATGDGASPERSVVVRSLSGGAAVRSLAFGALLSLLPPDASPVAVEFELVQRLRAAMVPQGVDRRILVVDDVDQLDEKSAGLIELLVRQGDVVVVATERTSLTGIPGDHALSHALRDHADVVVVPPMDDEELAELIVEWEGPAEVGSIQRLLSVSQGNPLVARELLEAARASGAIARRGGLWYLDGFHPAGSTIERLVGEHLTRLNEAEWELVRCIAVAGELPRSVAERIDANAVERLERSGVLAGSPVGLGHPLYGEVTQSSMTTDETRQICRKLLATIGPDDEVDEARLGRWLLAAGDVVDVGVARAGARRALSRWENDLARDLVSTIPEPEVPDLVLLQWAHANSGRLDDALVCADRAVSIATSEAERADAGLARSELLCLQLGRADDGYQELVALRESLSDPALIARVDGATALYSHMTGNRELATEAVDRVRAERSSGSASDPSVRVSLLLGNAFNDVFSGRFDAAASVIGEGLALAEQIGERHNVVRLEVADALRRLFMGDLEGSGALIDRRLRRADVEGERPAHVAWLGLAAQLAQIEGRFAVAERRDREAVRMADHVDDLGAGGFVRGDLCALAVEFDRDVEIDPRSSPIGLARMRIRAAEADESDRLGAELAEMTAGGGYVLWAPWVAREAVRRGPAPRCAALLGEYASTLEGPVVAAMADHALGMVDGDLERVEGAARVFLDLRCTVPAIDAGLDAVSLALRHGASIPLRRALLEFARVLALVTPEAPPKFTRRYDDLVDAAEMPSARQLQIATLAARGAASKEIAGELHLSVRTVDNHLAAVYRSLGVSSREELAAIGLS